VIGGTKCGSLLPQDNLNENDGMTSSGNAILAQGGQSHYFFSTDAGLTWKNDSVAVAGRSLKADFNHMIMPNR
jgi:hypothetical protein